MERRKEKLRQACLVVGLCLVCLAMPFVAGYNNTAIFVPQSWCQHGGCAAPVELCPGEPNLFVYGSGIPIIWTEEVCS